MKTAVAPSAFDLDDLRARVARVSGPYAGDDHGDHLLNPALAHLVKRDGLRDAAVLVPVVQRASGPQVILTLRTENLRNHSGQVAFPGGRIDPEDHSPEHAALRETEEEIGIGADMIEVIGRMPDYLSGSGYRIAPVFGIVQPDFCYRINPDEVAQAFEVPLSFLMTPDSYVRESRFWQGEERFFWTIPHDGPRIWGVTAGIIRTIYERLYG